MRGGLIVFEGVNGAGKTTLINHLTIRLNQMRLSYSVYKFPNRSGPLGERIDKYLKGEIEIKSKYDVLSMFAADRARMKPYIMRDLQEGKIVICDRYVFSAIAYHIPFHVHDVKPHIITIGHFDKKMPTPDLTFLIEGDYLKKRGIVNKEIFHYTNSNQKRIHFNLERVINAYDMNAAVIKNNLDEIDSTVDAIIEYMKIVL